MERTTTFTYSLLVATMRICILIQYYTVNPITQIYNRYRCNNYKGRVTIIIQYSIFI